MKLTENQIELIANYTDERYIDRAKLITYLESHKTVEKAVFAACSKVAPSKRLLEANERGYTVIAKTAKTITIQRDTATLDPNFKPEWIAGGFAGHCTNQDEQTYTYERNPEGEKVRCYWSERLGCYTTGGDQSIRIRRGRHEFYDYNF